MRRDISGHRIPVAFFFQFIDRRQVLLSISSDVHALTICFDGCTKRIVWISFRFFQNFHLGGAGRFIGVEPNINAIRKIVGINSHAFQIVVAIDKNTHLCIMAFAKIKIRDTTANLHDAILCQTTFIAIPNCHTA